MTPRKPRDPLLRVLVAIFTAAYVLLFISFCISLYVLLCATPAHAETVVGLHTFSAHYPQERYQNNDNFGAYVRLDNGTTFGAYRNTLGRPSVYLAYTAQAGPFGLTAGVITGYRRRAPCERGYSPAYLAPLLAPSIRLPAVLGATPRITLVPPAKNTVTVTHLSLEWTF